MPKRNFKHKENEIQEEVWDPVKELKELDLEDFLKCKDTREILICEHYDNFERKLKYKLGDFKMTEKQAKRILTLPINQHLKKSELKKICKEINNFYLQN